MRVHAVRARATGMGTTGAAHGRPTHTEAGMSQDHQRFSPIASDRLLTAVLALLITEREEHRSATAPRTETILARAGLTEADISSITGGDAADVRAFLDRDRPVSVIDRARAHMTRSTA